jgi:hypothetical protein
MADEEHTTLPSRSTPSHPPESAWRAYADREVDRTTALRYAIHLRRCAACRQLHQAIRDEAAEVAGLLALAIPRSVQLGQLQRSSYARRSVTVLAMATAAGIAVMIARSGAPTTHARTAGTAQVQDVCCFNLDGGGSRDDGMLTVSRAGQVVECVVVYEDQAGTRSFSRRDPLRFISETPGCEPGAVLTTVATNEVVHRAGL